MARRSCSAARRKALRKPGWGSRPFATTYTVTVTNAGGCTATDTHQVTVTTNPTATITAPAQICSGTTGHTASVGTQPGATYAWSITNGEVTMVRTQFGYHIVKVDSHGTTPFEQVKPVLERNARQEALQAKLEAMKTTAKPTFNETYFPPPAPPATEPKPEGATSKQQ